MQANELRIGNWVNNGFGQPFQIRGIISEGNTGGYKLSTLKPIPLTPKILEKCGFEKIPIERFERYHGNAEANFGYPVLYLNKAKTFKLCQNCSTPNGYLFLEGFRIDVTHLHQLQNLYFALTGEELSITHLTQTNDTDRDAN